MQSIQEKAQPLLRGMWPYRWFGIGAAWIVCIGGWIAVALLPTQYESRARVYINVDTVLTPLLKGLAPDADPERQVEFMQRTLLSRPNLEEAAHLVGLDVDTPGKKAALFNQLGDDIHIEAVTKNLLAISYRDSSPATAKSVVDALLTIFAEKTTGNRRKEMDSAEQFLDNEIVTYQAQLRTLELRRAELNRQYPELLPVDTNGSRFDRANNDVAVLRLQLSDAIANRDSLQKQLASVPPMLTVARPPPVVVDAAGRANSPAALLDQAEKHLAALRLKYTEDYPDIVAARREVAQLKEEAKKPSRSAGHGGETKTEIANRVYDQLKVKAVDTESAVDSIQRKLTLAEAELARIRKAMQAAPDVVTRAQDLERNYGVLKAAYEALVQRRQAAQIADAANTTAGQIEFRIIDPPVLPVDPASPNRPLYNSVILLIGLAAGLAGPVGLWQLDRSVGTIAQLRNFGPPILGSVSRWATEETRRRSLRQVAGICVGTLVLLMTYGSLLAFNTGVNLEGLLHHLKGA
jgi:polysaccharide chain length determinant protein (PEP-CTERM system associated)